MSTPRQSRVDRRRATEVRILDSARELFAEKGFERTTIRAVAASASVDPALVMQYFGSKRELFSQAVQAVSSPLTAADTDELVDQLLASLGLKLGGLPEGTLVMMRSMLTDQAAADHVRASLGRQIESVGAALPDAEDAELRAALIVTALLGVSIGHQLLGLAALREAPADRIAVLFRPAIKALAGPPG
ncbi:TetR/AcrR family transcriptional regulator [Streptomyces lasalocidi]|uniref:TetR/AcrR family transcriptional regulator n=1 Tax=Streptomyces lasalocidi TaxID=324833 RepID=A0A4U5W4H4_STRLS|nr:TetR/AcrR family transcriptional regulator [Streptomyces lasalocidi]TKS96307.1 TetR/AcrR family transcriptional regulator [Streptomyces lasalocidi]